MTPDTEALITEIENAQEWMRKPDWAENFSAADFARWLNDRPTHLFPKAATKIAEQAKGIERLLNAGAVNDRMLDNSNEELIEQANEIATLEAKLAERDAELARAREVIRPFAGDRMPNLRRTEIGYDRYGLRRCISPMELAIIAASKFLEDTDGRP